MPLHICDAQNCQQCAVRRQGSCVLCNRHLCVHHLKKEFHTCPDLDTDEAAFIAADKCATEDELSNLFSRINLDALRVKATSLRDGIPCTIPSLSTAAQNHGPVLMGGQNYHIVITLDDGVEWICRIRRENASSPPSAILDHLLLSEAATYRFLSTTNVPAPEVYYVATASPLNPVGVGYLLMERLKGSPMDWYDLQPDAKKKILDQFADIFIELKQHPLPSIGSLAIDGDSHNVGSFASEATMDLENGVLHTLGPFTSPLAYRTATLKHEIELILRGESYPDNAVDAYLVHRYVLENVDAVARREQGSDTSFHLKHTDDKGDQILVDESNNIVGIVDWERSQVASFAEAFAAPLFLVDVGAYYDGLNELSEDEALFASILEAKGHQDLALAVRGGCFEHRLMSCVTADLGDPESFGTLFMGLCKSLRRAKGEATWEAWKAETLQRHKKDPELQQLLSRQ